MSCLAIIPARKNSIRLKNKNKKKLKGKPLIEYTINLAKRIKFFKDILVSTDDLDIIKIAKNKKVLAPWVRPRQLSTAKTSSYKVVKHAVEWYEKNYNKIDTIFLLQPTSPFRTRNNILKTFSLFNMNEKRKSIISVSRIKTKIGNKKNIIKLVPNGVTYLISKKSLLKYKSFINKENVPYLIKDSREALDIDYPHDWIKAKKMIRKL